MRKEKHTIMALFVNVEGKRCIAIKVVESTDPDEIEGVRTGSVMQNLALLCGDLRNPAPCLLAYDKHGNLLHHMHIDMLAEELSEIEQDEIILTLNKVREAWGGKEDMQHSILNVFHEAIKRVSSANKYPDDADDKIDDKIKGAAQSLLDKASKTVH